MAKTKKNQSQETQLGNEIQRLTELAESLNVPEDIFDGEIDDIAQDEAKRLADIMKNESWRRKLNYLYMGGFAIGRLEEFIQEASDGGDAK